MSDKIDDADPRGQISPPPGTRQMSGAHTPGPWSFVPDRKVSYFHRNVYANDKPIAHVLSTKNWGTNGDTDANARLIAAAPELLEACKAVAASSMRNKAHDFCVAAIAKATGAP